MFYEANSREFGVLGVPGLPLGWLGALAETLMAVGGGRCCPRFKGWGDRRQRLFFSRRIFRV
jgi:hypothetical protein